ncbi:MAG TPA: HAD hydrolase family protein [Vicinamibacterales bacterium]|nr:HAD hydrolase family protein [Vicinamibacterales bacterium]
MKFAALALDYDGTIAIDGALDPAVRAAIGDLRRRGVVVILVTGRRLDDLRRVAGDISCFDVIVAENGAVLDFPASGRHIVVGHAPPPVFLKELTRCAIPFSAGESIVESDAARAAAILDVIHALEQPLMLAFNRSRVMALPQSIGKSTGLRHALQALRLSVHNTVGIGDAENDHDLLDACEVGVAVAWGSAALRAAADEVISGTGPAAVADYLRRVATQPRLSAAQMGRRHVTLGRQYDGIDVSLAVRGRTVLVAGEPGSGKSWLAGLLCEQLILQGYCLCIIDPEGDYQTLEALPGVVTLGGDDPPPTARELARALRHADASVIVNLSKVPHQDKCEYLRMLLPMLVALRRTSGLPHKILLDEAHHFLHDADVSRQIDLDLAGYIFVTYRISSLPAPVRQITDAVVLVTRETDPDESQTLLAMCRPAEGVSTSVFQDLGPLDAALLPGAEEAHGQVRRFRLAPRLTAHVRHRTKYLDMPVAESQAFVFTNDGRPGPRARTLKEFIGFLAAMPAERLGGHLRRHDFSRWVEDVFRDRALAGHLRKVETSAPFDNLRDAGDAIAQAIRARYETPLDDAGLSVH